MSGRLTDAYENIKNLYFFFINTIWRNGEIGRHEGLWV